MEQYSFDIFQNCAELITQSDGLLITAGAGMGVDSGLPDFRGEQGFWGGYPALGAAKISFEKIAAPESFKSNPRQAWGFYGHRLNLYRTTTPHDGFRILQRIGTHLPNGCFVLTSNVDGQFQKSGFDPRRINECHGSIHYLQCLDGCCEDIWAAENFHPEVDFEKCRLLSPLPECPHCGGIARPNIAMFNDGKWLDDRAVVQGEHLRLWLRNVARLLVIEIGVGTKLPFLRHFGKASECPLIRINPTESDVDQIQGVSVPCGGLLALQRIERALSALG